MKDYLDLAKEFQTKKKDDDNDDGARDCRPPGDNKAPSKITTKWSPLSLGALLPPKVEEIENSPPAGCSSSTHKMLSPTLAIAPVKALV